MHSSQLGFVRIDFLGSSGVVLEQQHVPPDLIQLPGDLA
jgi:hypothetical protein